ncbi:uncharacterized protein P174DRAFT_436994 [Aspergillus novofumigatus IBT 16806]|uniref:Uncharacterized protein n=1 Tax=Aspergillus novofumigatus (strain IBT 16806) TaxID=1392255 RepID=A0A2I1CLT2_ASPN1|nr:uncharacterized protein P174DRAFT_436994 [Aspergillus novofumigatus IBT 16806]PKX98572.1 hypothetical protein P174DRAFT_436994 [Aspergillus novofumigatus IBT 16806]
MDSWSFMVALLSVCSLLFPISISDFLIIFLLSPLLFSDHGLCSFVHRLVFIVVSSSNHFRPGRRAIVDSTCANLVVPTCVPDIRVHRPS